MANPPKRRDQARSAPVTVSAGDLLEYRVMRTFARQKYFVRRGVEIFTESFLNRATDLDVVAVRWIPPFHKHLQIVECKSGGNDRPLDRIFWLSGVKRYVGAESATLVRSDTKWDIKVFARECAVQYLDLASLGGLEGRLGLTEHEWPGLADYRYVNTNLPAWTRVLAADTETAGLFNFIQGESKWERPVPSMRFLLFHMRRFTRLTANEPGQTLWPTLLSNCLGHFIMFALSLAAMTIEMRREDVRSLVYRDAKYGSLDKRVIERFMRLAQRITEESLSSLGVSSQRIDRASFDYPEPQNVDELVTIQELLLERTGTAEDLAAFVDYVAAERFLHRRDGSDWIRHVYGEAAEQLATLATSVCKILEELDALPKNFSTIFQNKSRKPLEASNPPSQQSDRQEMSPMVVQGGLIDLPGLEPGFVSEDVVGVPSLSQPDPTEVH